MRAGGDRPGDADDSDGTGSAATADVADVAMDVPATARTGPAPDIRHGWNIT